MALALHFFGKKDVQDRPNHGDGLKPANLVPALRDGRGKDISPQLKFQRQRQVVRQSEPNGGEIGGAPGLQRSHQQQPSDDDAQPNDGLAYHPHS